MSAVHRLVATWRSSPATPDRVLDDGSEMALLPGRWKATSERRDAMLNYMI